MGRRVVIVTADFGELWIALLEGGVVVDLSIRPASGPRLLGTIAKGRITRLAPGVRAAFVQIGTGRDVFTLLPPGTTEERGLREGAEVLVQITREAQGNKGHRGTFDVTLPGWALVLAPGQGYRGVSRRMPDDERDRLRALLDEIAPEGFGLIARTAAIGAGREELEAELAALLARWRAIEAAAVESRAPALLYREESAAAVFVRDRLADGLDEIIVDTAVAPALVPALEAFGNVVPPVRVIDPPRPMLDTWGLERALDAALAPEVPLPGGGRLVIQSTEALVAVDVNSGRDTGACDLEDTALRTDLSAAAEIARQVRLRDLGGLVVVDFIDVERPDSRARINDALAAAFAGERVKSRVLPLSDFCVAQITRQRRRLPLERVFMEPCPCCRRGVRPRPEFAARRLLREARRRIAPVPGARARISAREEVLAEGRGILADWGTASGLPPERIVWAEGPEGVDVA